MEQQSIDEKLIATTLKLPRHVYETLRQDAIKKGEKESFSTCCRRAILHRVKELRSEQSND